ncbi:MAG: trypsin-like peptidase domain-containing protein [Acidimicrobiales bacterium]
MAFVEVVDRARSANWRTNSRMLVGAAFGFFVVLIGSASADETPSSDPAVPDVTLAPAVVVAAGADTIDTNAVAMLTAYTYGARERGTAFRLDDGRIATVAHALVDARGVGIGDRDDQVLVRLEGEGAVPSAIDELHDLGSFHADTFLAGLPISSTPAQVGEIVALAGFPRGERLELTTGAIISRTSGAGYGIERPDVYVIGAAVSAGWSGGPVVNGLGEVIAVIVAIEKTSGVAIAVPIEYLPQP